MSDAPENPPAVPPSGLPLEDLSPADLEFVVRLQKTELDRLLRENARLQDRIAQLIALQEREQILRQQMQSMLTEAGASRRIQDQSDLKSRASAAERRYHRLKQALTRLVDAMERRQG